MKLLLNLLFFMILINSRSIANEFYIYDTKVSKKIQIDELVKNTSQYDVIFFGEFHDDSLNHYLQDIYLKSFFEVNPKTIVSLEMFEKDVQKHLNSYLSDQISEEEFLKNSRPWPDYKKFYKTLVETAKLNHAQVLAANIPRKYAALYVQEGMTGYLKLSEEEKSFIAKTMLLKEDQYLDKFLETMIGDKKEVEKLSHNKLNTLYLYYGAQCIKDETMAESILEAINNSPGHKVVHFNGDFHSNSFLGTAAMLQRRKPDLRIAVITPIYYEETDKIDFSSELSKQANFVLFIPPKKKEPQMQMMGGASHFGENYAVDHVINLEIIPTKSQILGTDKIRFKNPILKSSSLKILNTIEILNISDKDNNIDFEVRKIDDYYNEIILKNKSFANQSYQNGGIKETFEVTIKYQGVVNFSPTEINLTKRHSNTPGIISPKENEGFYLPGGSYYPQTEKDLAKFNAKITLPNDYKLITTGDITPVTSDNKTTYRVGNDKFIDELILVGGKYNHKSKEHNGVTFGIYYYKDAPHLEQYLNESIKYFDQYTSLFGNYPYKSFNIVENFFPTGFGMPGFTLLSDKLTAMPWVTLSPGSLAHEFVHNWWGNSVFVDYEMGNWCEALTTFSTNYYYNIITNNAKEAIDWRRKALMAIDALPNDKNYPVNDFKYQRNTFDAVVGYSKGAFVFIELLKLVGNEKFFEVMKSFSEKYSGKRAYWSSLISEFNDKTRESHKDLKIRNIINDFIKTKDIPEVKFSADPIIEGDSLLIKISSSIKRVFSLPVKIHYEDETNQKHYLTITDTVNTFRLPYLGKIKSVTLDDELETLRKINEWEKPTSFNQVLNSKPMVILPEKESAEYIVAMEFVKSLKESGYDFEYSIASNISKRDLERYSLLILGNAGNNQVLADFTVQLKNGISLDKDVFIYNGKKASLTENILMANVEHKYSEDLKCSIISFKDLKDVKVLNRLIHYQSYSLVLLNIARTGRPAFSTEIYPSSIDTSKLNWINKN